MDQVQLHNVLKLKMLIRNRMDTPGALFGGVTLDKGGEDCVGEGELSEILGNIFFLFVLPKAIYMHPSQPN